MHYRYNLLLPFHTALACRKILTLDEVCRLAILPYPALDDPIADRYVHGYSRICKPNPAVPYLSIERQNQTNLLVHFPVLF